MEAALVNLADSVRIPSSLLVRSRIHTVGNWSKELISIYSTYLQNKKKRKRTNYFMRIEVPHFSAEEFKSHFRMNRSTVNELINIMAPIMKKRYGRPQAEIQKQILFGVWILANQETFRSVALRFGLERGNSHRVFMRFVDCLFSLRSRFIVWPTGEKLEATMRGFTALRRVSIPGTVGAVDGCEIRIKQPKDDKSSYYNRNKFHSVTLQGTCDHRKMFIDVFAGFPGAAHDNHVWTNSPLFKHLEENLSPNQHVLGDSAYSLSTFCLVRYKDYGTLSPEEKYYNKIQSSLRVIIEQAFGLLKCRFRRLKYLDMRLMRAIGKVIVVCCILHNICIMNNDILQYTRDRGRVNDDDNNVDNNNLNARNKRERIKNSLWAQQNN